MLEGMLTYMAPYMINGLAYAQTLAPFFLLATIVWFVLNMWLHNDKMDITKGILTPLFLCACLFFYKTLIFAFTGAADIMFGSLPTPDLSWGDIWGQYAAGFDLGKDASWWDKGLNFFTQGLSFFSTIGTWLAVQAVSFVQALVSSVQLFFKIAVMLSGPWAFLFAILPAYRKVASTWFNYLMYFSVWSISLWIVDALVMSMFTSLVSNPEMASLGSDAVVVKGGTKAAGGITKSLKLFKSMKGISAMGKVVAVGGGGGLVHVAGSMLYPFLALFLYFMVPSMTRFFFQTTGMENILSAGMAFITSKFSQAMNLGKKAGGSYRNFKGETGFKGIRYTAKKATDILRGRATGGTGGTQK